jgi:hypothetical protein
MPFQQYDLSVGYTILAHQLTISITYYYPSCAANVISILLTTGINLLLEHALTISAFDCSTFLYWIVILCGQ